MKLVSRGFATPRTAIVARPWTAGETIVTQDSVQPNWDAAADLVCSRVVDIDVVRLKEETHLGAGARLRLTAGWHCDRTRTRVIGDRHDLVVDDESPTIQVTIEVRVPGSRIAAEVQLEARLVLIAPGVDALPTAARLPGAVLWSDRTRVLLEPETSRFPMEWVDFSTSIYADEAAWALEWDPSSLDVSTFGGLRILLNQAHREAALLLKESPPSPAANILWDALRLDVARQLIFGALLNDEFVANASTYDEGSIGATIRHLLRTHFPHESIQSLRSSLQRSPTRLEARLQASLRAFMADD